MGIHFGVLYSADPEFKATPDQVVALEARKEEFMHRLGFQKEALAKPPITVAKPGRIPTTLMPGSPR